MKKYTAMRTKIYIANLSADVKADDVHALFSKYGEIKSIKLMNDPVTGFSRGYGFVEMASEEDTKNAIIEMRGKMFRDRYIWVSY